MEKNFDNVFVVVQEDPCSRGEMQTKEKVLTKDLKIIEKKWLQFKQWEIASAAP